MASRSLFASYHGRQWRQLWLTTPDGAAPLPLTFGEFDRSNARWSPDGQRIAYISNEEGNTSLAVQDFVGGAHDADHGEAGGDTRPARARLTLDIRDEHGRSVPARVAVLGSDGRAAAPADSLDACRRWLRPRAASRAKPTTSIARRDARWMRRRATPQSGCSAAFAICRGSRL